MDAPTDHGPPPAPPPAPPRRLTRAADGKLAGVCEGLGNYFGLDPVLIRLAFVLLLFAGGFSAWAYIVLWVVLPKDDGTPGALGEWNSGVDWRERLSGPSAAVLLVIVGGVLLLANAPVVVGLMLVGLGGWLLVQPPRDEVDRHDLSSGPMPRPASPSTPSFGAGPPAATPGAAAPPTATPPPAAPPAPPPPRKPSAPSVITPVVVSLTAVIWGVLLALDSASLHDVSLTLYPATSLLVIGAGLVVSATRGQARMLLPLGILMTCCLAVTATVGSAVKDGIGDITVRPASVEELEPRYELGIGGFTVNLVDVALDRDRRLDVELDVGDLVVIVPDDMNVEIDARNRLGRLWVFGIEQNGPGNDLDTSRVVDPDAPTLTLVVRSGVGNAEIVSAASPRLVPAIAPATPAPVPTDERVLR